MRVLIGADAFVVVLLFRFFERSDAFLLFLDLGIFGVGKQGRWYHPPVFNLVASPVGRPLGYPRGPRTKPYVPY